MKSICYFGPSYLSGWILLLWASLCVRQYPTDAFLFQTNLVETTTIGKAVKVAVRTQTDEYWLPPTKQLRVIRSVLNGRGGIYNHECDDNNDDGDGDNGCHLVNDCQFAIGRRDVIQNSLLSAASMSTIGSTIVAPAHASPSMATVAVPTVAVATDLGRQIDINCLTDLPPVADDDVRLYFCRHGQTENNRLRKVQGARVLDQPINDNGRIQSESLGTALARALLPQSGSESSMGTFTKKNVRPTVLFVSSPLQRAKMTASIAATQLVASGNSRRIRRRPTSPTATTVAIPPLDTLAEVDFGPLADGQPILLVQEKIAIAYATWASGRVDYRHEGGGDSGREVCVRERLIFRAIHRWYFLRFVLKTPYWQTCVGAMLFWRLVCND